jgi:hypothetical protein
VQKFVVAAAVVVLSLGFSGVVFAFARQFVDRADVISAPTFVVVEDESQAGWAHDATSPAFPFEAGEMPDPGADPHKYLLTVNTYEEAVALFGRDFEIPEIPGFYANMFDFGPADWTGSRSSVAVVMQSENNHIFLYAVFRDDPMFDWAESEIRFVGTIEEMLINNVKVYQITEQEEFGQRLTFLWEHNGLTYRIFSRPYNNITEAEYLEIIAGMIRQ